MTVVNLLSSNPYVFPGHNPGEHLAEPRKIFENCGMS
ncbi:MAG: hypothetical protein QG656_644 [Candidatus Hydrogenedentes bacterium]|nr:hypothetical protein [Candidatus Hydrogenedentota bacterium]